MCVPTFGYLRIYAYLQLPAAFRSLSRPSSAPDAKAFSLCSSLLELLAKQLNGCLTKRTQLYTKVSSTMNNLFKVENMRAYFLLIVRS